MELVTGFAAIAAFLAAIFVVFGLFGRRQESPLAARVRTLAAYAAEEEAGPSLDEPFTQRVIWPFLESVSNTVAKLLPAAFVARIRRMLILAGEPFSLVAFLTLMAISAFAFPALLLLLTIAAGLVGFTQVIGLILFLVLGAYLPYFWLARKVGSRQHEIIRSLPNALDLITTCVEAGLGLDSAFARVAEKLPGPFADELQRLLREMAMGRMRRDALRDLSERTGVLEVTTFVNALIHAEVTGASIGDVLRVQADQMRLKRRQRVEQTAQRIPIWMTFPLVLFLLPSLFIVILGPAGIQVWEAFMG